MRQRPFDSVPQTRTPDYGLLFVVATVFDTHSARIVQGLLNAYGVRATTTPIRLSAVASQTPDGTIAHRILVFPEDADRAYQVLCEHTT